MKGYLNIDNGASSIASQLVATSVPKAGNVSMDATFRCFIGQTGACLGIDLRGTLPVLHFDNYFVTRVVPSRLASYELNKKPFGLLLGGPMLLCRPQTELS